MLADCFEAIFGGEPTNVEPNGYPDCESQETWKERELNVKGQSDANTGYFQKRETRVFWR